MKCLSKIIAWISLGVMVASMLIPVFYWVAHPEITEMELFIKFIVIYMVGIVFGIIAIVLKIFGK